MRSMTNSVRRHAFVFLAMSSWASAVAAAPDHSRLGTDLTPVGAERAGNAEGTIPAWDGGLLQAPSGWTPPGQRKPANPDDKNAPSHFIPCDRKKIRSETCQ